MNAAFVVSLELPDALDPASIQDTATDIENHLLDAGFDVIGVAPWARPSLGLTPEGEDQLPLF